MNPSHDLLRIGLTPTLAARAAAAGVDFRTPPRLLRVTVLHRESLVLHDGRVEHDARPLPSLERELARAGGGLAVGDWVLAEADAHGGLWATARVAPDTRILRRDGDGRRHVVVANVDAAFVVMGLDDDFNLRRLERYLALVDASGIEPLVVLTKADVVGAATAASRVAALRERLASVVRERAGGAGGEDAKDEATGADGDRAAELPVFAIDGTDPATALALEPVVAVPGRTFVALGSSGAGKSTLTNTLLGRAVQDTGHVREHDGRGMHTTTTRSLHLLPGGACLIDTPGLRTLRADVDEARLAASFGDIAALAARCRFRDCAHAGEPGCAVREGVDADRLRNFKKMMREAKRDEGYAWIERRRLLAMWKSHGRAGALRTRMKRGG